MCLIYKMFWAQTNRMHLEKNICTPPAEFSFESVGNKNVYKMLVLHPFDWISSFAKIS